MSHDVLRGVYIIKFSHLLSKKHLFAKGIITSAECFVSEGPKKGSESHISFHHALQDDVIGY